MPTYEWLDQCIDCPNDNLPTPAFTLVASGFTGSQAPLNGTWQLRLWSGQDTQYGCGTYCFWASPNNEGGWPGEPNDRFFLGFSPQLNGWLIQCGVPFYNSPGHTVGYAAGEFVYFVPDSSFNYSYGPTVFNTLAPPGSFRENSTNTVPGTITVTPNIVQGSSLPPGSIPCCRTITNYCCPNEPILPDTLHVTFGGGTGACSSLDGLTFITQLFYASLGPWNGALRVPIYNTPWDSAFGNYAIPVTWNYGPICGNRMFCRLTLCTLCNWLGSGIGNMGFIDCIFHSGTPPNDLNGGAHGDISFSCDPYFGTTSALHPGFGCQQGTHPPVDGYCSCCDSGFYPQPNAIVDSPSFIATITE